MAAPTSAFDQQTHEGDLYLNFTGTVTLTGPVRVVGILVATTTGGTMALSNTAGAITGTITGTAGQWYPMPFLSPTTVTITVANTINATVFYS